MANRLARPTRPTSRAASTGPTPGRAHQRAARGLDEFLHTYGVLRQSLVQRPDLDQIAGKFFADLLDVAGGADRAQQRGGLVRRQLRRSPAGQQITQHRVQLVDGADPGLGEVYASFVEQGQGCGVVVRVHRTPVSVDVGCGRGGSVDPVVLAGRRHG